MNAPLQISSLMWRRLEKGIDNYQIYNYQRNNGQTFEGLYIVFPTTSFGLYFLSFPDGL